MWKRIIFFNDYSKKFDIYLCMNYIRNTFFKKIIREEMENPELISKNKGLIRIKSLKNSIEEKLKSVYKDITGRELILPEIEIKIDNNIKKGKIAGFNHPKDGEKGVMGIKEKALNDEEYLKWIITHELIHAAVGKDLPTSEEHEGLFKKLADRMGLPEKYQD